MIEELFQPFNIGPVTLRNRMVMPPMLTFLANENGAVTQRLIDYYTERAKGGVGLIIVESTYVREEDRDFGRLGIENPQLQVGLSELAESIQEQGAKVFLQLNHRGSVLSIKKGKGPDELSFEEIEQITEAFSIAALRALKAGFDGVEIHGANVYLITQFLSPLTNHRHDQYGQTLEGRMKLVLDILSRVRDKVGKEYPVTLRMVGHQYAEGGLTLEDTRIIARRAEEAGASALHVIAGSPASPYWHTPPMAIPRGCHVALAAEIKKVVRVPVIAVGRIHDPVLANQILKEGKADLVAMGRALIADPYLPLKAKEGRMEEIRKCLSCNFCRKRISQLNRTVRCAINPEVGREREARISPSPRPKKVLIVGGGPAGMEAARVLALRGHQVSLYERNQELGGQVNLAVLPPHKEELRNILDYLIPQMDKLNVAVHPQSEVTKNIIEKENPDVILLAAGANPVIPEIFAQNREQIFTPEEVLRKTRPVGERVLVAGGGMVGCEIAEYLANGKKKVTIVEKLPGIALEVEKLTQILLLQRLSQLGVRVKTECEIVSMRGCQVTLSHQGEEIEEEVESIVLALGGSPNNSLETLLRSCGRPFYAIGDCWEARDIASAIHDGWRTALQVN
jgi:2,4-dienoyl-CoA reductase-like NADH-dependent reductase (Old Yellow Enzyme family)/thioredoxin reductase